MTYYGTKLSDNITETPEGFLICHDVIIARTGVQDYAPSEVPINAKTSAVKIHREKAEVLRAETISSFEGKPVTAGHPDGFVTPDNWNELAVGFVKNVRASEDGDDGYIVADLVITNSKAIQAVKDGLREVSCGYEADYVDLENGEGMQTNILGNHVALVPQGRCGEKCSIQDQSQQGGIMTIKDKVLDALSKVFDTAESVEEEVMEGAEVETPESEAKELSKLDELGAKLDKLIELMSKAVEEEASEATSEDAEEETTEVAEDKGDEVVADADTIARAEIIAPGIAKDGDVKAKALDAFKGTVEGQEILGALSGVTGDALFIAASELLKAKRNTIMMRPMGDSMPSNHAVTAEDLNKKFADHWANKK